MSVQYIEWLTHTFDVVTGAHAETTTELRALCRENGAFQAVMPATERIPDPFLWQAAAEIAKRYSEFHVTVTYSTAETLTSSDGIEVPMDHAVVITLDIDNTPGID